MAIRIRNINGKTIAICAARSIAKEGDLYLDDDIHHALAIKFFDDYSTSGFIEQKFIHSEKYEEELLMEQEESNNENRIWWDSLFGKE